MKAVLYSPPAIEPVSLTDIKLHLRLDSGTLAGNLTTYQSIVPGSHGISAGGAYTHVGASVDILGKEAIVNLNSGTNGATGTVDCKIQESDDNMTWTDLTGGAFTLVTTDNDNAIQEKQYTGTKRYIRTVAKVLLAACEFGTEIIVNAATTIEDDLLTALITTAREYAEGVTHRQLITATWDYYLEAWPCECAIVLPFGNLQSVTSIKYKDTDGTETTLTVTTDYLVETNGEEYGRIVLPYGGSWPSGSLYPSNPIAIRFVCGWTTAANVPSKIRTAIKMLVADMYANRGEAIPDQSAERKVADNYLSMSRLWREF